MHMYKLLDKKGSVKLIVMIAKRTSNCIICKSFMGELCLEENVKINIHDKCYTFEKIYTLLQKKIHFGNTLSTLSSE